MTPSPSPPMPPEHESRPDERHNDLERLNQTFDSAIAEATKVILKWLVPITGAGVLMLVVNHFQQKEMAREMVRMGNDMGRMAGEIKEMRQENNIMSHKLAIMWSGGNWETKYRTEKE